MTLQSTNPITVDGVVYDRFHMSLNISATQTGQIMVNLRLVPTHVNEDGSRLFLDDQPKALSLVDLEVAAAQDSAIGAAAMQVLGGLQGLINAKGF